MRTRDKFHFRHLVLPDGGEADVYAAPEGPLDNGSSMNHFSPGDVLDLVARFARVAGAVLIATGADIEAVFAAN